MILILKCIQRTCCPLQLLWQNSRCRTETLQVYEYSIEKVWKDWYWSERFPAWPELRRYFDHVDKVLDIRKDVAFNAKVIDAQFDENAGKWLVRAEDGRVAKSTFLILATGFAAKRHFPDWPGLEKFQGVMHHSSFWPEEGIDVKGKRVGAVGTGSTGVQIAQELSKEVGDDGALTVFQRTPNLALPMQQRKLTKEEQDDMKHNYPQFYKDRLTTFAGFLFDWSKKATFDDGPEEREKFYQDKWDKGGFHFWVANYKDLLYEADPNREAYNFWAKKQRARIQDPRKKDILAPLDPPHSFGTKRPSLEQDYYEQFNRPNVDVVNIKQNPIKEVVEDGLILEDGSHHKLDILALATGFDSVTGGMKNMGLKDVNGVDLRDKWKQGTWTHLGITCCGFPNMFFLYAAQAPTAFSNGPSTVEMQGDFITKVIGDMRAEGIKYIDPTKAAEDEWREVVTDLNDETLFPGTSSWYNGGNVPGKPREQLNYLGGVPKYNKVLNDCHQAPFKGFKVVKQEA